MLRHIWEIVAGTSGSLTQVQLVQCLYLMDQAKRGLRPPPALPPGPFPPVVSKHLMLYRTVPRSTWPVVLMSCTLVSCSSCEQPVEKGACAAESLLTLLSNPDLLRT